MRHFFSRSSSYSTYLHAHIWQPVRSIHWQQQQQQQQPARAADAHGIPYVLSTQQGYPSTQQQDSCIEPVGSQHSCPALECTLRHESLWRLLHATTAGLTAPCNWAYSSSTYRMGVSTCSSFSRSNRCSFQGTPPPYSAQPS
jgi:hypothetical protein